MNHAARFAAFGVGWVMPKVLMKAFAMRSRNFIEFRCTDLRQGYIEVWEHVHPWVRCGIYCDVVHLCACCDGARRIH